MIAKDTGVEGRPELEIANLAIMLDRYDRYCTSV